MAEMDSDTILDILGSDTRRRILAVLSQEPMYFNQLAREIGVGQQAVLRHLQALEAGGIIEAYGEKSGLGAPDRKYYRLNTSFVLTVSLSEDDFSIKNERIVESRHKESRKYYRDLDSIPDGAGRALSSIQESLANIEDEISALASRMNDLLALKQLILRRLHEIGHDSFEEDERRILYKIVEESPKSVAELSSMMDEKESDLRVIIAGIADRLNKSNAAARSLFENLK